MPAMPLKSPELPNPSGFPTHRGPRLRKASCLLDLEYSTCRAQHLPDPAESIAYRNADGAGSLVRPRL